MEPVFYDPRQLALPPGLVVAPDGHAYDANGQQLELFDPNNRPIILKHNPALDQGPGAPGAPGLGAPGAPGVMGPSPPVSPGQRRHRQQQQQQQQPGSGMLAPAARGGIAPGASQGVGMSGQLVQQPPPPPGAPPGQVHVLRVAKTGMEIAVVEGSRFNLPPGLFIGPDGSVYNGDGQRTGQLEGYAQRFGRKHPRLPERRQPPHVDLTDADQLLAEPGAEPGSRRPSFAASPHGHAMGDASTQSPAPGAPGAPGAPPKVKDGVVQDAYFEDGMVLVHGTVIGTVDENGMVLDLDGHPLGMLPEESRQVVETHERVEAEAAGADVLAQLLEVPNYHPHVAGGDEDPLSRASVAEADRVEKWEPVVVTEEPELVAMEEPPTGMEPMSFRRKLWEKKVASVKTYEFVPSRFKRPFLAPEFPPEAQLSDVRALHARQFDANAIQLVWLKRLPAKLLKQLPRTLKGLPNLRVLGLFESNISKLELVCPSLLRLDLPHNAFEKPKHIKNLVRRLPRLQALDIRHNPICSGWNNPLPPTKHKIWETLLGCHDLEVLNGRVIPNEYRHQALQRHGTKSLRRHVPRDTWNHAVNQMQAVSNMREWDPALVQVIHLRGEGLSFFNVSCFVTLTELNLSKNHIESFDGCGLQRCQNLVYLDMSDNDLSPKALPFLGYLGSLQQLFLMGNPRLDKLGSSYRRKVIFNTRFLRGSNRAYGLLELDGQPVTIEERVQALVHEQSNKLEDFERWTLNLIDQFGHAQLRTIDNFTSRLRALHLGDRNVAAVDLRLFSGLEVLDLSANRLTHKKIVGLLHCQRLRVLDLSHNAGLKFEKIAEVLTAEKLGKEDRDETGRALPPLMRLEQVAFATSSAKVNSKHVRKVMRALSEFNPRLAVIDGVVPSVEDRVKVFSSRKHGGGKVSEAAMQRFRVTLGIVTSCTPFAGRSYDPEDLHTQVDDEAVESLLRMNKLELTGKHLDLMPFVNLRQLNLADNKIESILDIGIPHLKKLELLDVRNNRITMPPKLLGPVIEDLPLLTVLAVRGNPAYRNKSNRQKLIAAIPSCHKVECRLRVIDTPLTVDDRIAAIEHAGDQHAVAPEQLRFQIGMHLRCPPVDEIPPRQVPALNLDNLKLTYLALRDYSKLEVLRLRNNNLRSIARSGIASMQHLRVLDLRDNKLRDLDEVLRLVNELGELQFLGLIGNTKFAPRSEESKEESIVSYRSKVLGHVRQLRRVGCPLQWLDSRLITGVEVADAWLNAGGDARRCAMFLFDHTVHERLPEDHVPQQMQYFDLSRASLVSVDLKPFLRVVQLNLSRNNLTWKALEQGHIHALTECKELSLSYNKLRRRDAMSVAGLAKRLPKLTKLYIVGQSLCPDNSRENRRDFLKFVPGIDEQHLTLEALNGRPIRVSERVDATLERSGGAMDTNELESVRLVLTLESVDARLDQEMLDLSGRKLRLLITLRQFTNLRVLNLSNNNLHTLRGQCLDQLPRLETLDLRNNQFKSLDEMLVELRGYNMLRHLYLADCLASSSAPTTGDAVFEQVTEELIGLMSLDDKRVEHRYTELQIDAAQFLYTLCNVGLNTLRHVSVEGANIPADYLFYFLAALAEFDCVETLVARDNPWQHKFSGTYRFYCIMALGDRLHRLDDMSISSEERFNALNRLKDDERYKRWKDCRAKAHAKLKGDRGKPFKKKYAVENYVDFVDVPVGIGAAASPAVDDGVAKDDADGAVVDGDGADGGADDGGAGGGGGGGGGGDGGDGREAEAAKVQQEPDQEEEPDQEQEQEQADRSETFAVNELIQHVQGSFLNKLEIFINFLQIYGLILILDVDIDWPETWFEFSEFVKVFAFDIDFVWDLNLPYQQQLKFAIIMTLPAMFIAFYVGLASIDKEDWILRYYTKWQRTKRRAWGAYLILVVLAIVCGFLYDTDSWARVKDDRTQPTAKTNGLIAIAWLVLTFAFLMWYVVVRTFRSHYIKDRTAKKAEFFLWWLRRIFWLRRASLFLLTILFLPVARVILEQGTCFCEDDDVQLAEGFPQCHILHFPEQECLFIEYSNLQLVAAGFAVVYLLGIPIFYFILIRRGVHQMVDIQGYKDQEQRVKARVDKLDERIKNTASKSKRKELKKRKKQIKERLDDFYYDKCQNNRAPQSYLFASFSRNFRFYRIASLFQKLALVVLSVFAAAWLSRNVKLFMGVAVQLAAAALALAGPFADRFETVLEGAAQVANFVNAASAVALHRDWLDQGQVEYALFLFDGGALLLFALATLASPFIACYNAVSFSREAAQLRARDVAASVHQL